jgi:hypothetical protein
VIDRVPALKFWVSNYSLGQFACIISSIFVCFQLIVPPVLNAFLDQDSRVRYYACEALYNIAKVNISSSTVTTDMYAYANVMFYL